MPACIAKCSRIGESLFADRDGPQGIYWIGEEPKILFAGREHFGWYGSSEWPTDMERICFSPLEFAYHAVPSMGSYWNVIKEIISDVLQVDISDWDSVLREIAITNACKCFSDKKTYQWQLHQNCLEQSYLSYELEVINAPVNVLFTKAYGLCSKIFHDARVHQDDNEFLVVESSGKYIIECAHPGRQSHEWRLALKEKISYYLQVGKNTRYV